MLPRYERPTARHAPAAPISRRSLMSRSGVAAHMMRYVSGPFMLVASPQILVETGIVKYGNIVILSRGPAHDSVRNEHMLNGCAVEVVYSEAIDSDEPNIGILRSLSRLVAMQTFYTV